LLATVGLILIGMASTTWWGPHLAGNSAWALPLDLWGTLAAAQRLLHLDLSGLYTQPTGLVSFPGTALILVPVVALIDAAGISLRWPGVQNTHPAAWLLAGPYEMALSALALFAADAVLIAWASPVRSVRFSPGQRQLPCGASLSSGDTRKTP